MDKYKTEIKLQVVNSFLAGEGGAKLLARRWDVPEEKIRTWVSRYRLHGIDGLRPKRSAYSSEFKMQVLSHQDRERLSSRRVAAIYDIRNPNQVVVWRRDIAEGDAQALRNTMPKPDKKPDTKPEQHCSDTSPTATPASADALRKENERLRAEVAYLKKVHALIRAKRSVAPTKRA
jgi:transposase